MSGSRAKSIRRYIRNTFPMLPEEPRYKRLPHGPIVLDEMCQRKRVKVVKINYKRKAKGLELRYG